MVLHDTDASPMDMSGVISCYVNKKDLTGSVDNGMRKNLKNMLNLFFSSKVTIEAAQGGVKDSIFFAPEEDPSRPFPAPTHFVKVQADPNDKSLVRPNDDFEISFVGMSVVPEDTLSYTKNELLLYSLTDRTGQPAASASGGSPLVVDDPGQHLHHSKALPPMYSAGVDSPSSSVIAAPAHHHAHHGHHDVSAVVAAAVHGGPNPYILSKNDVPYIHYDPLIDGHDEGADAYTFASVPASKSLYYQHKGAESAAPMGSKTSVAVRFLVLEVDKVTGAQARTIQNVMNFPKRFNVAPVPLSPPLSMAIGAAAALGRQGLRNYRRPDHVLSRDAMFILADGSCKEPASKASSVETADKSDEWANFLRYGYYFFLSKKVDAKLYAQTSSSTSTVPLLLRRSPYTEEMAARNEKEFFPLEGVSYVVMRVSRGVSDRTAPCAGESAEEHRQRLEAIRNVSHAMEILSGIQRGK